MITRLNMVLEMVGSIVHQLTDGVCPEELRKAGLGDYYTEPWGVFGKYLNWIIFKLI